MRKNMILLFCLLLLGCFIAGCDSAQTQQPSDSAAASNSISLPPGNTTVPVISSDNPFIVKDVNGGDYDLASTTWGIKYPFMVDYFRDLLEEIRANGGDEIRETEICSNWTKTVLPDSCVTAQGTAVTSLLGFDGDGNLDPNGPQLTTTVRSAVLEDTTTLAPELLEAAFMEKAEGQGYLTVELTIENTGNEDVKFTLNSIIPSVFVDGERAPAATAVSEMISATNTGKSRSDSAFFHCTLFSGQSQDYTVVFYVDRRIELGDIYLQLNYLGTYDEPIPTADPIVSSLTGTYCALK